MPLVSVILVNFNGKKFLDKCVASILDNHYVNFEIIVVDNNSIDSSIDNLEKKYIGEKRVRIIRNVKNSGPAGALNLAAANAKGKYLAILGYDTEVDQNWLTTYVDFMQSHERVGIAQGKLMRIDEKDRFFYIGDYLGPFGFLVERGRGKKDKGQFNKTKEIFGINSATMIMKTKLFRQLGGFDERFFMYLEETDLCFRIHLMGLKVMYVPKSVVYHHDSTKVKKDKVFIEDKRNYYGCRNYIWMLAKNWSFKNLILRWPIHILAWIIIMMGLAFKKDFKRSLAIAKALLWHIINFFKVVKSRIEVQAKFRKVKDSDFSHLFIKKDLSYYWGKAWAFINNKAF